MDKQFFLYGAGELGRRTLENFQQNGFHISAIIDRKATGYIGNVPILHLDDIELNKDESVNSLVIICLNAGMQHREVANNLYHLGFIKIVFLPMEYAIEYKEKVRMTALYNEALRGLDVSDKVKSYQQYITTSWEDVVIRYEPDDILTWIGQEIFFSENKLEWKGDITKVHCINGGIDVNMNAYYWLHDLFDYLDGKINDCASYLSIYNIDLHTVNAQNLIEDRERLVADLRNKLSNGIDFFIEAATNAVWNSKGYFNIVGGNHRNIFLQHQGYIFYPARISRNDYKIWKNEEYLQEVINYIEENDIQNTYVPVPHPSFRNFPYLRERWGSTVLGDILRYLGPIRLTGKKIVDVSQYEGYFARVAKRMYADKAAFYAYTDITMELAKKLFKLLHIDNMEFVNDINALRRECQEADIIFGMLNTEKLIEMDCVQAFSGKLFSEFCAENSEFIELVMKKTKMNNYRMLHREVFQGKLLEVGVFET